MINKTKIIRGVRTKKYRWSKALWRVDSLRLYQGEIYPFKVWANPMGYTVLLGTYFPDDYHATTVVIERVKYFFSKAGINRYIRKMRDTYEKIYIAPPSADSA